MTRMLLAIESSTDWLSVALLRGEEIIEREENEQSRQHASALLPAIDLVLGRASVGLDDLEAIGIATGPGSFTSLRIGLATIKGLALGRSLEAVGISTLEAMAFSLLERDWTDGDESVEPGEVVALLDARRGQWYAGGWSRATSPDGLAVARMPEGLYDAATVLKVRGPATIVMTPDAPGWRRACEDAGLPVGLLVEGRAARPRADSVGRLAARRLALGQGVPVATLEARYLRRAEAEAKRLSTPVETGELARFTKS